jgi:type I restriction enzyme S subunit
MRSKRFDEHIEQNKSGSTFFGLSQEATGKYLVLLPTIDEQASIAEVLSDMDAEIEALEQRRDKTQKIKQGMMQQLLTGRVRLVNGEATA